MIRIPACVREGRSKCVLLLLLLEAFRFGFFILSLSRGEVDFGVGGNSDYGTDLMVARLEGRSISCICFEEDKEALRCLYELRHEAKKRCILHEFNPFSIFVLLLLVRSALGRINDA